ncbi:MAG: hypothetical protein H6719_38795 [Sandaracinaceae bacterium]|nr:hypothetical protein [Sandaracinaceae bacterium]
MLQPLSMPDVDIRAAQPMDPELAEAWLDLALEQDDTRAVEAFYEAQGCVRMAVAAEVIASRVGGATPDLRSRFETASTVATEEGLYVVVEQAMDCNEAAMPRLVTVFAADSIEQPDAAGWMESYGVLEDEARNLAERVDVVDGLAYPTAISLVPVTAGDDDTK